MILSITKYQRLWLIIVLIGDCKLRIKTGHNLMIYDAMYFVYQH